MNDERALFLHEVLSPERLTRVVDVGANPLGATPYSTLLKNRICDVWGFEPQQDAFARLSEEGGENETYLPYAIGRGGSERLHVCKGSGFTSLFEPNPDFIRVMGRWPRQMRVEEVVPITTHRLDDLKELPEFDLLKIDVQGGELDVFRNAREKLKNAVAVISEIAMVPLYKGQPLLDSQMSELSAQGFHFHKFLFLKSMAVKTRASSRLKMRAMRNQAIDGDAVFLKRFFALEDIPTESLKHLAILADAVFQSPDVALMALEVLADRDVVKEAELDTYEALVEAEFSR